MAVALNGKSSREAAAGVAVGAGGGVRDGAGDGTGDGEGGTRVFVAEGTGDGAGEGEAGGLSGAGRQAASRRSPLNQKTGKKRRRSSIGILFVKDEDVKIPRDVLGIAPLGMQCKRTKVTGDYSARRVTRKVCWPAV
ncbi:MAG: hypothetical protein D6794_02860 [Deltaproteobacteria bacterium]|nr:MAG: hypothetical protein D6794_02860 [Deltaproteobacteria bacterium]